MVRHEPFVRRRERQGVEERLDASRIDPALELAEPPREARDPTAPHRIRGRDLGTDIRIRGGRARVDHHDVVPGLPAQADRPRERPECIIEARCLEGGRVRFRRRRNR